MSRTNTETGGSNRFSTNKDGIYDTDDQDSSGFNGQAGTQNYQNGYDVRANYGPSNFDQRHALKTSAVYQVPVGKGRAFLNKNAVVDAVIGGWSYR